MIDKTKQLIDLSDETPRIIKCDGTEVPFPPKNGKDFDFREIQEALRMEGNTDPLFSMAGLIDGMRMVAEDNGYALNLPYNEKASWFYCMACGIPIGSYEIVGNALLFPEEMMQ